MTIEKQKIFLDASCLKKAACLLRVYRESVQGYRGKMLDISMEYGSAYHKFPQALAETSGDVSAAHKAAQEYFFSVMSSKYFYIPKGKEWLNVGHLALTCNEHVKQFGPNGDSGEFKSLVVDGKPLVEQTFCFKYREYKKFDIYLCGTIDCIGKLDQGCYAIGDYKTTSAWNHDEYLDNYYTSLQLRFYLWAVKRYGKKFPDSVFAEMCRHRIGCFINGVFLSKTAPTQFKRSKIFFYSDEELEEMELWLNEIIRRLVEAVTYKEVPLREGMFTDQCTGKYPGYPCEYIGVCKAPTEQARQSLLGNSFNQSLYNPLKFRK